MAIPKTNIQVNFSQGVQTKSDPWQVPLGQFLALENSVFGTGNMLQKRNGFAEQIPLPNNASTTLTTFNDSLVALGNSFLSLAENSVQWINNGSFQPVDLDVTPAVRNSSAQLACDVAVAENGMSCAVYADTTGDFYYQILDVNKKQVLVPSVALPASNTPHRAFVLGNYFIIVYIILVGPTPTLQFISIPMINPLAPNAPVLLSTQVDSVSAGLDGVVSNDTLYLAWDGSDLGGSVRMTTISTALNQGGTIVFGGEKGEIISLAADDVAATPSIWVTYWDNATNEVKALNVSLSLVTVLAPTVLNASSNTNHLASVAANGVLTAFAQITNTYSYSATRSDYIAKVTCTQGGTVGTPSVMMRSVGIASSAFYLESTEKSYLLVAYQGTHQPTYFLVDSDGSIVSKLAYSNGGGYVQGKGIPRVHVYGTQANVGYLFKASLTSVNKSQNAPSVSGIYAQTGVNVARFDINNKDLITAETGNNLHVAGGILWAFDGVKPVEQGFNVWPEDLEATPSAAGGTMSAQLYNYQVTYEWTDAQGNLHRSAPSIPLEVTTTTGTSSVTLDIPTLRLTYKDSNNPVRIVIYRWSVAQQTFYQITSILTPLLNDPSVDSVQYVDTAPDADILGNVILYTTGGVVENIGAPASSVMTLFKNRLFVVDAEDKNLVWYSKQVLSDTPVEMSDLFTLYISPTIGSQGSTGDISALSALDDKIIFFKSNAIYYVTGNGPDNTGANNDFSEPVFITGTVGCTNQQSVVQMPAGLMFQSDKGIWLLGRDLSTQYIGAPVERYTLNSLVKSAIAIPGTNQVRFTMDSGLTLMYDYFFGQWGTFTNIPAISSTLYEDLHTYLNDDGQVFQETPGQYLDGSKPVLLSFTTAWVNLAALQGFQRAYEFYFLGKYITPHRLKVEIAYDYDMSVFQQTVVTPDNYNAAWGTLPLWGSGSVWGGPNNVEQWRIFFAKQKCQSFLIRLTEIYDPSFGVTAGAGFTMSGLDLTVGGKLQRPKLWAARQAG